MSLDNDKSVIVVVGGGLVGCLQAIYMADRGYRVKLFEKRGDIRLTPKSGGRSRNLTLAHRGVCALERVGLADTIKKVGIPAYGRCAHLTNGLQLVYPYGEENGAKLCLYSMDRHKCNSALLSHADKHDNIDVYFEHKLVSCDFDRKKAVFLNKTSDQVLQNFYLLFGCDGAKSAVRQQLCQRTELNFSQFFLEHRYVEVGMPYRHDQLRLKSNHLHIWPRNQNMLVGLENPDRSFTGSLIMPISTFKELDTKEKAESYFHHQFADIKDIYGDDLVMPRFPWQPLPMVSIKCDPFHYKDACVLLGDAAHAMVPFHGQGMNCALEDCLVFADALDKYEPDMNAVLAEFSRTRVKDAQAMVDLSLIHYADLATDEVSFRHSLVVSFDRLFSKLFPFSWMNSVRSINFSRASVSQCLRRKIWQEKVLNRIINIGLFGGTLFTLVGVLQLSGWDLKEKVSHAVSSHLIQTYIVQPLQRFKYQPQYDVGDLAV